MENTANHITLTGTLASLPEYSHQNHERRFFRFLLAVERLSGTEDLLPVLAAEDVLEQAELFEGERFTIEGQIRSFNNREPTGRRLILCVYALSMMTTDAPMQNEAVLTGTVCKPPFTGRHRLAGRLQICVWPCRACTAGRTTSLVFYGAGRRWPPPNTRPARS